MKLFRTLRARQIMRQPSQQPAWDASRWTPDAIQHWQLSQFNAQWPFTYRQVPYFRHLQQTHQVPDHFENWQHFQETVPILERPLLQDQSQSFISQAHPAYQWRTTGGSTYRPLHLPVWQSEMATAQRDLWYGRAQLGISPADRLFLLWGHSHGLGHGLRGTYQRYRRRLLDVALGYYRWSAYDLSPSQLRRAGEALLRHHPSYLVGYANALTQFALVNRDRSPAFHHLNLKCAIATAESFPHPESQPIVADILGCPVTMEYGSVETGPIAQQQPSGAYRVFWRHYMIEAHPTPYDPETYDILLTSLFPRCMPLIRYRIGDLIRMPPHAPTLGICTFTTVVGRRHDVIALPNGTHLHAETFSHAIKETHAIRAYQIVQDDLRGLTLYYTAAHPLCETDIAAIRQRLQRMHADLGHLPIRHVQQLSQSVAGKTLRLVRPAA